MKKIAYVLILVCFSCNNKGQKNKTQIGKLEANNINSRTKDSLILHHFRILDSVVNIKPNDTLFLCCRESVDFLEKLTKILADADSDYFGTVGFKKKDLELWHHWYEEKYK